MSHRDETGTPAESTQSGVSGASTPVSQPESATASGVSSQESPPAVTVAKDAPRPYEILSELGRGGMGVVYLARQVGLERRVALKMLKLGDAAGPEQLRRFEQEARAAARLDHPGIVGVYEIGEMDGSRYIAMEFVDGKRMDRWVRDAGIDLRTQVDVIRRVAESVEHAHQAGIIHRDLKPANVLVDGRGAPHVADFGLAKEIDSEAEGLTRTGSVMGTPHYMSPEQVRASKHVDLRTDVWALGVMLYEALTGKRPFEGDASYAIFAQVITRDPVAPRRWNPQVPSDLETICLKSLEKEPWRRHASAGGFAAELGRWLAGEPIESRRPGAWERAWRWSWRHRRFVAPSAAAAVAIVALGVWGRASRQGEEQALLAGKQADARAAVANRETEAEQILARAEGLWREAKAVLRSTAIPLARYHQLLGQAMHEYDEAIAKDPAYGWIYESRGRVKISVNDLAGAEADLKRAIDLLGAERGKVARRSLGRVYLERSMALEYAVRKDNEPDRMRQAKEWRARALIELDASAGSIAWRGTADEGDNAARLARGFSARGRGNTAEAERIFREGVEQAYDEECAWGISRTLDGAAAATWREKALQLRPRYTRALFDRGSRIAKAGDNDDGIKDYDAAIEIDPKYADAWFNRGIAHSEKGEQKVAIADFDRVLEIDPKYAGAWLYRGLSRQHLGDLDGAIADASEALKLEPEWVYPWVNRADARAAKRDFAGALADYAEAIRLDPRDSRAVFNRGNARGVQGDLDGAIADFSATIAVDPQSPRGWVNRASMKSLKGDLDGTIADCEKALALDANDARAHHFRGIARQSKGDVEGAIADYDAAIQGNESDADALVNRAALRASKGDMEGTIADCEKALALDPNDALAHHYRGIARHTKGDKDGAITDYDAAIQANGSDAYALVNRAALRAEKGDLAGATADMEKALPLIPADAPERKELEQFLREVRGK